MRASIAFLLLGAALIGGCDRQSAPGSQASAGQENIAAPEAKGTLDRTHKGEAAPATPFLDPQGKQVTLASFRGKPVLLNLWATWCVPCIREMPTLDALAGKAGDSLAVVTLSQDLQGAEVVAPFFAKAGYAHLKPYLDTDAAFSIEMGANLPTTILYDRAGREVWRMIGDFDWAGEGAAALIAEAA